MEAKPNGPKSLDLFCGIGGLTLGLQQSGIECLGGVDKWKEAARTFDANLSPTKCLVADLAEVSVREMEDFFGIRREEVDLIAGGPPCQGFSTVGKRQATDERNSLWRHFLEIVSEVRPPYVLMENVEGLVVMDGGAIPPAIEAAFAEIGYLMRHKILVSADYGVPQLRKRVIFLGWLDGLREPRHPTPLPGPHTTVWDAISDLPPLGSGESATGYSSPPNTEFQRRLRGTAKVLHNHEAANHPAHLVEILRHIPDGGNRKSIPEHLQPRSGFHNSYSRLASDKPAVAVTSNMRKPSSSRSTHPKQDRGLTVREGLRLQTFEDSFVVLGPRTSQYLQVGNAVPVSLAREIGKEIVLAFNANSPDDLARARTRPR